MDTSIDQGAQAQLPAGDEEVRRSPWSTVAAALSLVYIVWYAVDLTVLNLNAGVFNAVHRQSGGFVPRVVFAVLVVGVLYHALDGLRCVICDFAPSLRRHGAVFEAAARFVTLAVGIPAGLVVVWPAVQAWWLR
jgi:succinate dehydrogenase/fumarate reductase cytochrome b subunit